MRMDTKEGPMPLTTIHRKAHTRVVVSLASVVLCLLPALVLAQPPQFPPDLRIENFSVYSTLLEGGGFRRVSISFPGANPGQGAAGPSTTRVLVDNSGASFATPGLGPGGAAYITRSLGRFGGRLAI